MRAFKATKAEVFNRGHAPDAFLDELIEWARQAPDEIFAPNDTPLEIYTVIKSRLAWRSGTDASGSPIYHWESLLHRKAALMEAMRVHAGMESSWNPNEDVDKTNAASRRNKTGRETGWFQVSFDSEWINHNAMKSFAIAHGIETVDKFIPAMKANHPLALEYYARLSRISIAWAGPLLRHGQDSIYPWLSGASLEEFAGFLL